MYFRRITQTLLLAAASIALPIASSAGVFVSIRVAPPLLPVYTQPVCPGDGYIWTPGYWAWGAVGYYWVPGTWILAPRPGLLWTPGYWAFGGGGYLWHAGYWGPHVGFYGGVNYGFGYTGIGFAGGFWSGGHFNYNRSVTNVNIMNVHNVYNRAVINNVTINRTSFNGPGGMTARPTPQERGFSREQHIAPTAAQFQHEHAASTNRAYFASVNHGRPPNAAMARPLAARANFSGGNRGVAPNRANTNNQGYNRSPNERANYNSGAQRNQHPTSYETSRNQQVNPAHEHSAPAHNGERGAEEHSNGDHDRK